MEALADPNQIYNSDETYTFSFVKLKSKNVYKIKKGSKKLNLTVLFTFSANIVTTPPTIIIHYTLLPSDVARSLPND